MLRVELASLYAWYFYRHLQAELQKPEDLLNRITTEGDTFAENTKALLLKLITEFPESARTPEAPFNFTEKWTRICFPSMNYQKSTYKAFNHVHLAKLIDMREGTEESRNALKRKLSQMILTGTAFGRPIDFRTFFASEQIRRGIYIEIAKDHGIPEAEATALILEQFDTMTDALYEYFDNRLSSALRQSDDLLLSILPRAVMDQLKEKGHVDPM